MTYESFAQQLRTRFLQLFVMFLPDFSTADLLFGRGGRQAPTSRAYLRFVYNELEGDYEAIGKITTQTGLLSVDIYVPVVQDLNEVERLADGIKRIIDALIVPNGGFKRRLSKRDFQNEVGGFAHSRVSVTLNYDV